MKRRIHIEGIMKVSMKLFFSCIIFFSFANEALSQFLVSGKVTDAETGQPILGVHVFISQSQIGSYSLVDGHYELNTQERRTFSLVFSHIGYFTQVFEIANLNANQTIDIELKPDVKQLSEIRVDGKEDKKWGRYLKRFKNTFLGANHDKEQIMIKNDFLADFSYLKGRDYRVDNQPIFKIDNHFLGYEVEFQLLQFQESKGSAYFGYSNFIEMEAANTGEAEQWRLNRRDAYNGSLTHFFRSVLENTLGPNGFGATYITEPKDHKDRKMDFFENDVRDPLRIKDTQVQKSNISIISMSDQYYEIAFDQRLEIVYFDELDGFGEPQKSEIKITAPLQVYPNGIIKNPEVMVVFGFLADRGIYELLPFEYNPETDK